jgi:hypothetical protein
MCPCYSCQNPPRRSLAGRVVGLVATLAFTYVGLLLLSGTLINTGNPLAIEIGELVQVVTFVEPAIHWAQSSDLDTIANGLRLLSSGLPINEIA